MGVVIGSTSPAYVQENETEYRARFYVNPNGLTMGRGGGVDVLRVQLQKSGAEYQIRAEMLNDAGVWMVVDLA